MSTSAELILKAYHTNPPARRLLLPRAQPKPRPNPHSIDPIPRPAYSHLKRFSSIAPSPPSHCPLPDPLLTPTVDALDRLEALLARSHQARTSRLHVQMEMLNLGVKEVSGRGGSLAELEDLRVEDWAGSSGECNPADALLLKYENQLEMRVGRLRAAE